MTVVASTLHCNSAVSGRAICNFNSAVVSRTIMANTCDGPSPIRSAGDNIVFETPPCFSASQALNDRISLDPQLLLLADNGGPTPTHLPAPGSPAIDEVRVNACTGVDQRAVTRSQGARCDICAVETVTVAIFVMADYPPPPAGIYVVRPPGLQPARKVRVLTELLIGCFQDVAQLPEFGR